MNQIENMTGQTKKYIFPTDFWWGTAASATQMEGAADEAGKGPNIWDYWYEQEPNRFFDGVSANVASNFYHRYEEDIALMKELGHNSFRLSISWSRLFPTGEGKINPLAVDFYNRVIDELIQADIEPFVNLYHFDMPLSLQQKGGWENREVVMHYVDYAKTCFELFGDRVSKWFTHNEPIVPVEGGYLYDFHYPNVVDFKRAVQVAYHSILSSALAIQAYKEADQAGKIGIILNLTPSYPRSQNEADVQAAHLADILFNRSFLDPSVLGTFPQELIDLLEEQNALPVMEETDRQTIAAHTVDLLGINYYQPRRIKVKEHLPNPAAPFMPEHLFDYYEMPGRKMNRHRGWEIYEKGVYDILTNLRKNYGNIECFISENGMGVEGEEQYRDADGSIQDDYRIDFIAEHLKWVHLALEEGSNVKGYHLWTFMDNWSWSNAYKNRYGFVGVDLASQTRTVKKSGHWFKQLIEDDGFIK
ncbi:MULTISPECIES: glycoside hydrolase family 1 protein [Exiguobacterium]|uniref:glycoside hydrolase family 1 protein n=2 Tax=Exiguobacterium TaxID=33986 RepID=UPI001BEBD9EF|nr:MULTISPECIES: glycoside hydrolase family 1 protein [Exiguobacterium]MCT4792653.1 glycoside hydrolase family 1 protein [Exiguobacterium artemiae]